MFFSLTKTFIAEKNTSASAYNLKSRSFTADRILFLCNEKV